MHKILRCLLLTYILPLLLMLSGAYAQSSVPDHTISIEGRLLMLDDATPHVAVAVQAIRGGKLVATVLSDNDGKYRFANLQAGIYRVRCYTLNGYLYYGKDKPVDASHAASLHVQGGRALENINFRFAPLKKGTRRDINYLVGLAGGYVLAIHCDPNGMMWFGTHTGVSRYDGKKFVNFTARDGLAHSSVRAIHSDPDGVMWFGTPKGISRYDGKEFVTFTTEDGLVHDSINAIHRDPDGVMWIGTYGGVSRYDGKKFVSFTTEDGLVHDSINAIHRDPDGFIWFGTYGGGVSRYDGKEFISLTTEDGLVNNWLHAIYRDPDGMMWFGCGGGGVSRYDGKEFINFTTKDGLASHAVLAIHSGPDGVIWFGTNNGVSRYDGKGFINFTTEDILSNWVNAIYCAPDGIVWFGTNNGVSRYDAKGFVNLTTQDGLLQNSVRVIHNDPDGVMWLGTRKGISRYDRKEFVNLTAEDGLVSGWLESIYRDPDGILWFGTDGPQGGISRYDGKKFVNFTTKDGLAGKNVKGIDRDRHGIMWFGARGGGVSRYDGREFVNFTTEDGLASNGVHAVYVDPAGVLWFGTGDSSGAGGVSRYDGREFVNFTTKDGLASNWVHDIYRDPDGVMWFGTQGGVSRYDSKGIEDSSHFVNFTIVDGLAYDEVLEVFRDMNGVMWFGTWAGGVSMYDGTAWSSLDTRDGLAGNNVGSIAQDSDGFLWFGTEDGVTRYQPSATPPKVYIVSVTTDQTYEDLSAVQPFTPGTRVTIEYSSIDFKTIPEKRQYRYRVYKVRANEHKPSFPRSPTYPYLPSARNTAFDWIPSEPGRYIFEVQAIDRDLNYSEPASLELEIVTPFYMKASFLVPTLGSIAVLLLMAIVSVTAYIRRHKQIQTYQRAAVAELQDAREMQLSLLPESAPSVSGMEIAGRSIPANTVGGDFFDYLSLQDDKVGIAMADVSGKGLRAAMNAVLADGMMHEVAIIEPLCGKILSRLNAHLYPLMEKQMFTAFSFAILDQNASVIQWSNAAQPHPLTKRSDGASEAEEDGQLPLGMAPDVRYPDYELKLQPGDIVIFYTDGIIEAENEAEEMYGTDRLLNLVAGIDSAENAQDIIEDILQDVSDFAGSAQQYDDMTVVVLKKV